MGHYAKVSIMTPSIKSLRAIALALLAGLAAPAGWSGNPVNEIATGDVPEGTLGLGFGYVRRRSQAAAPGFRALSEDEKRRLDEILKE